MRVSEHVFARPLRAVCLYLTHGDRLLAVSRPTDSVAYGLPGGKVEPGESDEEAIVREVREETGYLIRDPVPVFGTLCEGETSYFTTTFIAEVVGRTTAEETLNIAWVTPGQLLAGPFGVYNQKLFKQLRDEPSAGSYVRMALALIRTIRPYCPFPWKVSQDWSHEVVAANGHLVAQFPDKEDAQALIAEALRLEVQSLAQLTWFADEQA